MKKLKRIAKSSEVGVKVTAPFSDSLLAQRKKEYPVMPINDFIKKYRNHLFTPVKIEINGTEHELQFNYCTNPLCSSFGLEQKKYVDVLYKPSRYKIVNTNKGDAVSIQCNDVFDSKIPGINAQNSTTAISNWSVAEEIKRLIAINAIVPIESDYEFHKEGCSQLGITPFRNPILFYKRGKSSSNSQKYQCKECKKITNVLPKQDENFAYHQQRNDILNDFIKDITSKTPVRRTCEKLKIGSSTYYSKLEWVYRKCLEFLEEHETKPLKEIKFNTLWLNSDLFVYYLNNIKQKGCGRAAKTLSEAEKKLDTYMIATSDIHSWYVFRSDITYDYNVTLSDVENDTLEYCCDHTYSFLRKNERLKYPYAPQPPTTYDNQSYSDYLMDLSGFNRRKNYVEGCHTKQQYTMLAHFWLIKQLLNFEKLYMITDDDSVLKNIVFRGFVDYFKARNARYFTCQVDKTLSLKETGTLFYKNRRELLSWIKSKGVVDKLGIKEIAKLKIEEDLFNHEFFEYKNIKGFDYPIKNKDKYLSIYADKDEGYRILNCLTDISDLSNKELANILVEVNCRSINNFYQIVRRKISILERPLVSGRGDGKSYIYSNYNPKYAQYITTILRTLYNFCWTTKKDGKVQTPAQRLGITDKVFDYKDIIYSR